MSAVMTLLKAADRSVSAAARTVSTLALAGIFVMFIANVFVRFVPVYNFTQTDDWIQILLVWMIFPAPWSSCARAATSWSTVITDRVAGTNFRTLLPARRHDIELVTYAVICWYGRRLGAARAGHLPVHPLAAGPLGLRRHSVSAFFMTIYGVRDLVLAVRAFLPKKAG